MSFAAALAAVDWEEIRARQQRATADEVAALLRHRQISDHDLPLLFAPAADGQLEVMAQAAKTITAHRFGKIVNLYAPLYLSNECVNNCLYCGFAVRHGFTRRTLTAAEAVAEAEVLHQEGFRHILLVSGEAPHAFHVTQLAAVVARLADRFASIGIEVFPMRQDEYERLERAGVDNLALYQETYDREMYAALHRGPKADFAGRLAAIESGGVAGFRSLGIGALLGLTDWRREGLALAMHGRYLQKRFWQSRVAVSFPRLRPAEGGYQPAAPVSDRDLAQLIVALRLALPDAEIVISTRERAALRDRLIPLGVTRMSAGSKTNVGGYQSPLSSGDQFLVDDDRPPPAVARAIEAAGREAVWKDFDRALQRH